MYQENDIRIYLTYDKEDIPYDREALGNFIRQQNDIFTRTHSPYYLQLIECEDTPQLPDKTDLVVSLSVQRGGGADTLQQIWNAADCPAIMTYFRTPSESFPVKESYLTLKSWLEEHGHYWTEYPDVAVVMLKLLVHLQQYTGHILSYTKNGENICISGQPLIRPQDFSALKNHPSLIALDLQIDTLDAKLDQTNRSDNFDDYAKLLKERNKLQDQRLGIIRTYYAYLEKSESAVSDRLVKARNAVTRGNWEEAKNILNPHIIRTHVDEVIQTREITVAQAVAQARQNLLLLLQEYLTLAQIMQMEEQTAQQIASVCRVLLTAADLEQREHLGIEAREQLTEYLLLWDSAEKAVQYSEELVKEFAPDDITSDHARALTLLAKARTEAGTDRAEIRGTYEKALQIWQKLYESEPEKWFVPWAQCCNDSAMTESTYSKRQNQSAASLLETAWQEASGRYEQNPAQAAPVLVSLSLSLGDRKMDTGDYNAAAEHYADAEDLLSAIPEDNLHQKDVLHVTLLQRVGYWYLSRGDMPNAATYLREAMTRFDALPANITNRYPRIRFRCCTYLGHALYGHDLSAARQLFEEALAYLDSKHFHNLEELGELAKIHGALGTVFAKEYVMDRACTHWATAQALCDTLEERYADAGLLARILTYRFIGDGYLYAREHEAPLSYDANDKTRADHPYTQQARFWFKRAVDLHEKLETKDFQAGDFTWTLFMKYIGVFDFKGKAACSALYRRLQKFDAYKAQQANMQLAIYYTNLAQLCDGAENFKEAESNYQKALDLYRPFVDIRHAGSIYRYVSNTCRYATAMVKNKRKIAAVTAMLEETRVWVSGLYPTVETLSAKMVVCDTLYTLYKPSQEKARESAQVAYYTAKGQLEKLKKYTTGGR